MPVLLDKQNPYPIETERDRPIVVYVTVSGVLGGVDTYIRSNLSVVSDHYEAWIVVGYRSAMQFYRGHNVAKLFYLPMTKLFGVARIFSLVAQLRKRAHVIIHTNDLVTSLWGKLFALLLGRSARHLTTIHSVVTEHRIHQGTATRFIFGANRLLRSICQDAFICVSDEVRKSLRSVGIARNRMPVLYNAVARPLRAPRPKMNPDLPIRVGFVGRLSYEKGPDLFLECVSGLPKSFEPHVYGEGKMQEIFFAERARKVIMHGFVADEGQIYSALDIVCITSRTESCPFVFLEALSAGCVVLALDLPVFHELLAGSKLAEQIICSNLGEMRTRIANCMTRPMVFDPTKVDRLLGRFDLQGYRERLLNIYSTITSRTEHTSFFERG